MENLKLGDFSYESGYKLANELINKKNTPTAIFAVTDNLAIAAIDCLKDNFSNTDDLFEFAKTIKTGNNINEFVLYVFKSIEKTNDVLKLLLKSIDDLNPKILEDKKNEFIEEYAYDLAQFLEEQNNE